jgi:DNA-binding response OmpR family regulator
MQLLDTFEPDMVVVDPDLPGNGGEIVLAALSNEDLAHRTPVILLVSQTRHAALYNSGRFTIHDFLLQPLSPARLVLRIRYLASCGSRSPARTRPRYAEAAARNEDLLLTNV